MNFTNEPDTHGRAVDAACRKGSINYECYRQAARRERAAALQAALAALGRRLRSLFAGAASTAPASTGPGSTASTSTASGSATPAAVGRV